MKTKPNLVEQNRGRDQGVVRLWGKWYNGLSDVRWVGNLVILDGVDGTVCHGGGDQPRDSYVAELCFECIFKFVHLRVCLFSELSRSMQ